MESLKISHTLTKERKFSLILGGKQEHTSQDWVIYAPRQDDKQAWLIAALRFVRRIAVKGERRRRSTMPSGKSLPLRRLQRIWSLACFNSICMKLWKVVSSGTTGFLSLYLSSRPQEIMGVANKFRSIQKVLLRSSLEDTSTKRDFGNQSSKQYLRLYSMAAITS